MDDESEICLYEVSGADGLALDVDGTTVFLTTEEALGLAGAILEAVSDMQDKAEDIPVRLHS